MNVGLYYMASSGGRLAGIVLPVPATFVIDRAGPVRAALVDVDYRKRVEPCP